MAVRYVTDDMITFDDGTGGPVDRRVWLVNPPGRQSVVVVLQAPGEGGTPIEEAPERIARAVAERFPGHVTVLHYDQEAGAWGEIWVVVAVTDGDVVSGEPLDDHPDVRAALTEAGLV